MKLKSVLSLFAVLLCLSCKHEEHKISETVLTVTSPITKDTIVLKQYVSQIQSIQHIELRALEKGYLQKIFVDEGQIVKKGQILFQILPTIYQAEAQVAKAEMNAAEIEYQNTKKLADNNIVSKNELALSKAKLDKAKAELDLANAHLSFTEIKAPFDGIVGRFYDVKLGSLLDEGELLTTLSDNSTLWVYFNVPEAQYLDYISISRKGESKNVNLIMANNELFPYSGIVEAIGSDFNNETGNIAFRAKFPNPDKTLRHGQTGNIQMSTYLKNALIIPQEATFDVLDKKYVYVIDNSNKVNAKEIKIGVEMPHLYTVVSGLSANDKILIDGLRKVKNNDIIKTKFQPIEKVLSELGHLHAE